MVLKVLNLNDRHVKLSFVLHCFTAPRASIAACSHAHTLCVSCFVFVFRCLFSFVLDFHST
jgi:hypothetical protein